MMERPQEVTWVLLVYKVPREPTALRATVWRRLKRLGALLIHDAVWVLPATPWTREQFQWLAVEIGELGGEVQLWEARLLLNGQEDTLVQQFLEKVEAMYRDILAELEQADADLVALSRKYQQARAQDYFQSALGQQVRDRLLAARGGNTA
jgi:DNA-binding transcriptional regulator PaaX